jgi:hypothetical protein
MDFDLLRRTFVYEPGAGMSVPAAARKAWKVTA